MCAPQRFKYPARSAISGSRAAFVSTVVPLARAAASSRFSVAPTLGNASETNPPRNPPGAVHNRQPCSSRISAPSLRSASKCRSMGLGPSSHPPGNDNLASPQRDRIAPKNTIDERISRMRLWGISQRVMPSAQTVKVSPVWAQRHPSRRKMVTAVCTSDSAGQLCSTVSPSQRSAAASSGSVLFFAPCTVSSPQRRLPPRTKTASCRAQPVCSSSYSSIYTPRIL